MATRFYSIEFKDADGETNIKHAILRPDHAMSLCAEFAERGISATLYEIGPPPDEDSSPTVLSFDDPQLEGSDQGFIF